MAATKKIADSTLNDRYQITLPEAVREALRLKPQDKLTFEIQPNGNVLLSRSNRDESDPALESFLAFLAKDMLNNPDQLKAVTPELMSRIQNLVGEVDINLEDTLENDESA